MDVDRGIRYFKDEYIANVERTCVVILHSFFIVFFEMLIHTEETIEHEETFWLNRYDLRGDYDVERTYLVGVNVIGQDERFDLERVV